uniref:Adenosine deaminase n=1 Tax=Timema cristinae TaxID=61476 RepID=A0A7R9CL59_TIMCR|nr:unnamed protein product [Timema cristinae]
MKLDIVRCSDIARQHVGKTINSRSTVGIAKPRYIGASLHGHTFSLASTNFLINNLTYLPQLYMCVDTTGVLNFKFSEKVPDDNCDWVLLEMLRASSGNATFVDEFLRKQITLETDHPTEAYPTITEVWEKFQDIFTTVNGLTRWRVAFEMYYNQVLQEFYEDNVMYLEIRGTIPKIYDLDGTIMPWKDFLTLMNQLNKQFSALHPDFLGTKLIISPSRTINDSVMDADIQRVVEAHKAFPDLVVGIKKPGFKIVPDWEGVTDMNLVDAVLMNATRIGHGYALNKHPLVLERIKEKDIGIEVNPISNQVLMLVDDMRNHPAATLLADDYPVVISPDDPSFWGAKGLSYDMYEVFMGMAGVEADLKLLKQLAINSINSLLSGGALHLHDTGLVSTDYVMNLTYRSGLFMCTTDPSGLLRLHFFVTPDTSCEWEELSAVRRRSEDVTEFDHRLRKNLTMVVNNPRERYPNINAAWRKFSGLFSVVNGMVTYKPLFEEYYYQTLQEFLNDGVAYIELRGVLPNVYDLDGTIHSGIEVMRIYEEVTRRFQNNNPEFIGAKFIYAPSRRVDNETMDRYLNMTLTLKNTFGSFLAGFDLVGQEDRGRPLKDLAEKLLQFPEDINLFFHAGETNWQGMTDENLIDTLMFNATKRIGHGYALLKHPLALREVKRRGIALEINPISNQVLMLVEDLRNHPAAALLADDYPVVISSDDPSFWGAKGLSYDMYEVFMGMAGVEADLKLLKQLAINSIEILQFILEFPGNSMPNFNLLTHREVQK